MSYQVIIKGMKDENNKVDVANSEEEFRNTTVEELRRKIASKYCYKYGCRLIYKTQQLEDHHTLGDLGITQGSTLFCFIRMPGGGYLPKGEDGGIHRTESMEKLKFSM